MHYGVIKKFDIADGEGVRVSLYVSGCRNHCKGCFNQETWDFCYGYLFTEETENEIIEAMRAPYISGLSLLGGDPFEPENEEILVPFLKRVREELPEKTIWCYTGYIYENLKDRPMIPLLDVLIDGPFIEELKDITLQFRGSKNQRILRLKEKQEH